MDELKAQFIERAVSGLKELSARLGSGGGVEDGFAREAFRLLHTIKGTAQTFGLAEAARFAHDLESRLAGSPDPKFLADEFSRLANLLKSNGSSEHFEPGGASKKNKPGAVFISRIPRETLKQLSETERISLPSAGIKGMEIACLEAGLDLPTFTADFKKLKEKLDTAGETIATLPGENRDGKIFFKFFIAIAPPFIERLADEFGDHFRVLGGPVDTGIYSTLARIGNHILELAAKSEKEIYVFVSITEAAVSARLVETVFGLLLHLARNAVDHAFSARGTIYIDLRIKDKGLLITVEDNGRGLDPGLIRSKALEKGLIGEDVPVGAEQMLSLIFSPGFSTSETVNDLSGRGVGLDAVKGLTEEAGGTISVTSEKGKGTIFEIYLPA